jgi:hypothetical protein
VSKVGGLWGMARPESLLRASNSGAAFDPALAGLKRQDLRDLHGDPDTPDSSWLGVDEANFLDDSPTLRVETLALATDARLATAADRAVPASKRFAAWSRRYLMLVAGTDALVGGIAAAVPASVSDTLAYGGHRIT